MTAFARLATQRLESNIYILCSRLKAISAKTLTHEAVLSLFVPAEHRAMFRSMADLSNTGYAPGLSYDWSNGLTLKFTLNNIGKFPPPIPRHIGLQPDAPEDLVSEITRWSTTGGDPSGDFGRVRKLFSILNEEMTRSQIRFVWPSIAAIANADKDKEDLLELAGELSELKAPTSPPQLPHGLLLACRKTAATIAMTSLIPADVQTPVEGEVTVRTLEGAKYNEPGLGEYWGIS